MIEIFGYVVSYFIHLFSWKVGQKKNPLSPANMSQGSRYGCHHPILKQYMNIKTNQLPRSRSAQANSKFMILV